MIIVIQCAASKSPKAGHLRMTNGREVMFVADPARAPKDSPYAFAHPDDMADTAHTWRESLVQYNREPGNNPLGILPAWQLYQHPAYSVLAERFGLSSLYILSAGWGLISANFLTPAYDITFSQSTEAYKRRRKQDKYADLCQLQEAPDDSIVFLGGKDYVNLFCRLTAFTKAPRYVVYNSVNAPPATGCELRRYKTKTRTNWHYECARALVDGQFQLNQ